MISKNLFMPFKLKPITFTKVSEKRKEKNNKKDCEVSPLLFSKNREINNEYRQA